MADVNVSIIIFQKCVQLNRNIIKITSQNYKHILPCTYLHLRYVACLATFCSFSTVDVKLALILVSTKSLTDDQSLFWLLDLQRILLTGLVVYLNLVFSRPISNRVMQAENCAFHQQGSWHVVLLARLLTCYHNYFSCSIVIMCVPVAIPNRQIQKSR